MEFNHIPTYDTNGNRTEYLHNYNWDPETNEWLNLCVTSVYMIPLEIKTEEVQINGIITEILGWGTTFCLCI